MAKPKGSPKTGGRKPGSRNKVTRTLVEAIDKAFEQVGGAQYLARIAEDDPKAFCALLGKRLPRDLNVTTTLSLEQLIAQSRIE
jgi:hypothetical protein